MQYAKRFERICAAATLFAALCLFSIIPQTAFAYSANADEAKGLESMMSARNMGYMEGSELLLDWHGNPAYLIGYASDGYIIIERETFTFMEQGAGRGPYSTAATKKYYGGALCYAEECDGALVDARTGEALEAVPYCPAAEEAFRKNMDTQRSGDIGATSREERARDTTIVSCGALASQLEEIKGMAFGYNGGAYDSTCSAVALGIALNYLDETFDGNAVPQAWEHEQWVAEDQSYSSTRYPNATALHHHLVDDCGLDPLRPLGQPIGVWAFMLTDGFDAYMDEDSTRAVMGLGLDWYLAGSDRIPGSVDANVPAMLTTTFTFQGSGEYDGHTMVAYGYRNMSDGSVEVNLHSGWYSSSATAFDMGDDTYHYYMGDIWLPSSVATITYCFEIDDGWHHSGSGDWKYYEDELPVTGWKTISGNTYHFDSNGVRTTGNYIENGILYVFDNNGVLVSQSPISSPFTGPSDDVRISGLQVAYQKWLQSTGPDAIPAALERAMQANPDVFGWLYVPGTDLSLPLAMDGPGGSYYLDHGAGAEPNGFGCAFGRGGSRDLSDVVTVLYGHSFSDVGLAFTSLHSFEGYSFFAGHGRAYVYLPGRRLEYRIVAANLFNSRAIEDVDQSDAADLADYFAELSNPDPAAFTGFKRAFSLDPASDRILQLSTCTVPADPAHRYVVTCVYVGEEAV